MLFTFIKFCKEDTLGHMLTKPCTNRPLFGESLVVISPDSGGLWDLANMPLAAPTTSILQHEHSKCGPCTQWHSVYLVYSLTGIYRKLSRATFFDQVSKLRMSENRSETPIRAAESVFKPKQDLQFSVRGCKLPAFLTQPNFPAYLQHTCHNTVTKMRMVIHYFIHRKYDAKMKAGPIWSHLLPFLPENVWNDALCLPTEGFNNKSN